MMHIMIWLVLGVAIAIPYTFLANGTIIDFTQAVFFGPPIVLLLFVVWNMENARLPKGSATRRFGSWPFWMLVAYFCLPIILNGFSIVAQASGNNTMAHHLYVVRYSSMLGLGLTALSTLVVVSIFTIVWRQFRPGHGIS